MSLDFGLKDVHVLVTGASGGIGQSIVHSFLQVGARVTAQYNSSPGALSSVPNITTVQANVRDESSISDLFEQAAAKNGGPIAVLVANHGFFPPDNTSIADMSLERWQQTIDINLTGTFLLCKHYLRQLRTAPSSIQDRAAIVIIGSTSGKFGEALHADYAASKGALMSGFLSSLKNEIVQIAPRGRVNAVNPGWTATAKKEETLAQDGFVEKVTATVAMRKVARTEDVARQVVVLASGELSGHVSGTNVMVDGGMEGRVLW